MIARLEFCGTSCVVRYTPRMIQIAASEAELIVFEISADRERMVV